MGYECIAVEREGAVETILHNRPNVRNAENQQLLAELDDAMTRAAQDSDVKVIILGGTGDHFSAGHDLKEGEAKRANLSVEERWAYEEQHFLGYCMRIWDHPKPTIARVQGACLAGAFMVANMCDLMVASDDAYFGDPVVHSIGAAAVEVLVHPHVLGLRKAKEMLYTGERISAAEAREWGMVNRVVPRADLEAETMRLAQRIAGAPSFGIKLTKRSLNRAADLAGFRSSIMAHFDTHELTHFSEEMQSHQRKGLSKTVAAGKALISG